MTTEYAPVIDGRLCTEYQHETVKEVLHDMLSCWELVMEDELERWICQSKERARDYIHDAVTDLNFRDTWASRFVDAVADRMEFSDSLDRHTIGIVPLEWCEDIEEWEVRT